METNARGGERARGLSSGRRRRVAPRAATNFGCFGEGRTHGYTRGRGLRWNARDERGEERGRGEATHRANVAEHSKRHASLTFVPEYLRTCYLAGTISAGFGTITRAPDDRREIRGKPMIARDPTSPPSLGSTDPI